MRNRYSLLPIASAFLFACGTGQVGEQTVSVSIHPTSASVRAGDSLTFTAAVRGAVDTSVTWSVQEGASGGTVTSAGVYSAPASAGVFHVVVASRADSTKGATATVTVSSTPGGVARPGYNTGVGFFALNGKLYDASGVEFHPKGFDTLFYALDYPGLPNSKANVVRMNTDMSQSASTLRGYLDFAIGNKIVPMPFVSAPPSSPGGAHTTCSRDRAVLTAAVDAWISSYSVYKPYEKYMLLNIANEWGSDWTDGGTAWQTAYIAAVQSLRNAGYLCTIVIDAGGCGQDPDVLIHSAAAVMAADPQHNVLFSWHIYAGYNVALTQANIVGLMQNVATAASAGGFPVIIGEFAPALGSDIAPITVMQTASSLNMGWIYWAWDDWGTGWEVSYTGDFSVTNGVPTHGLYPNNTELSPPGNTAVLHPQQGTFYSATKASIFQ